MCAATARAAIPQQHHGCALNLTAAAITLLAETLLLYVQLMFKCCFCTAVALKLSCAVAIMYWSLAALSLSPQII